MLVPQMWLPFAHAQGLEQTIAVKERAIEDRHSRAFAGNNLAVEENGFHLLFASAYQVHQFDDDFLFGIVRNGLRHTGCIRPFGSASRGHGHVNDHILIDRGFDGVTQLRIEPLPEYNDT